MNQNTGVIYTSKNTEIIENHPIPPLKFVTITGLRWTLTNWIYIDYWIYVCICITRSVYKKYWIIGSYFVESIQCKKRCRWKSLESPKNVNRKLLYVHKEYWITGSPYYWIQACTGVLLENNDSPATPEK